MRVLLATVLVLCAVPAGADSMRFTVGARVFNRCFAAPTGFAPRVRCSAATPAAAHYEFVRNAEGMTLTILF